MLSYEADDILLRLRQPLLLLGSRRAVAVVGCYLGGHSVVVVADSVSIVAD